MEEPPFPGKRGLPVLSGLKRTVRCSHLLCAAGQFCALTLTQHSPQHSPLTRGVRGSSHAGGRTGAAEAAWGPRGTPHPPPPSWGEAALHLPRGAFPRRSGQQSGGSRGSRKLLNARGAGGPADPLSRTSDGGLGEHRKAVRPEQVRVPRAAAGAVPRGRASPHSPPRPAPPGVGHAPTRPGAAAPAASGAPGGTSAPEVAPRRALATPPPGRGLGRAGQGGFRGSVPRRQRARQPGTRYR